MAEPAGLSQLADITRKPSRPPGKNAKIKSSMKRSQSQFDAKELSKNGFVSTSSVTLVGLCI